jgi:hypothetical protein
MESPMYREYSRYQKFWASQFRRMVRIVLWAQEEYNGQKYETYEAEVSTDKLLQTDLVQLVSSLGSAFGSLLAPYADKIPADTQKKLLAAGWQLVLQTMGISDTDLTSEEAFGIGVEEPAEPVVTEVTPPTPPETTPEGTPPGEEEVIAGATEAYGQFRAQVLEAYKRLVALREANGS